MSRRGVSRAEVNKEIRQQALRDQLADKKLERYVLDTAKQLADLNIDLDSNQIARLRASSELRLRLVDKYLPSLKSTEVEAPTTDLASLLREAGRLAQSIASDQRKAERELQSADVVSEQVQVQPSIKAIK